MTLSRVSSIVHTYLIDSDCLLEGSIEALVTLLKFNLVFAVGGSVLCVVSSVLKYRIDLETAETSDDKLPEKIKKYGSYTCSMGIGLTLILSMSMGLIV